MRKDFTVQHALYGGWHACEYVQTRRAVYVLMLGVHLSTRPVVTCLFCIACTRERKRANT